MITIQREFGKEVIDELKPLFVEDYDYTRDVMAVEFKNAMEKVPDDICVITAKDGHSVLGFLVAFKQADRSYAYLAQAYSVLKRPDAQKGFDLIIAWAKSIGLKQLRVSSDKSAAVLRALKQWGFKQSCVEMLLNFNEVSNG